MPRTPPAEVEIDERLIAGLLAAQAPGYSGLPLEIVAHGWDTVTARLGNELAVRVPRRAMAAKMVVNEQRWLPVIAPLVEVDVPVPLMVGGPQGAYPWTWSIVPWFEGSTAEAEPLDLSEAGAYGEFLRRLHVAPPAEAPTNPFRGSPLAQRHDGIRRRWEGLRQSDTPVAEVADDAIGVWGAGVAAPLATTITWGHGDLHWRNLLTRNHRLTAVIDWVDVYAGDPATDLASVWALFPSEAHDAAWEAYGGLDSAARARARAWAIAFAAMFVGLADDPGLVELGIALTDRVLESG